MAGRLTVLFCGWLFANLLAFAEVDCNLPRAADFVKDLPPRVYAEQAGLNYLSERGPGYGRRSTNEGDFVYLDTNGKPLKDKVEIERIDRLGIPPGHVDVWISPDPLSHIQAIGRDTAGRSQYRYHENWTAIRSRAKYRKMTGFGLALPTLRRAVAEDLQLKDVPRKRVIAAIVRLLDRTAIRIGSEEYAAENETYGLSTMEKRHVTVRGAKITFEFVGKAAKAHSITIEDAAVAALLKDVMRLPGDHLFDYRSETGDFRSVTAAEVNDYLRLATELPFTAKDFRTWKATSTAVAILRTRAPPASEKEAKEIRREVAELVSDALGNLPATALGSYIFPEAFPRHAARDEILVGSAESLSGLSPDEAVTLRFLERHTGAR